MSLEDVIDVFKLYTIDEVRDILGVSRLTVYNYINRGVLKAYKPMKKYQILGQDLIDFIKRNSFN